MEGDLTDAVAEGEMARCKGERRTLAGALVGLE